MNITDLQRIGFMQALATNVRGKHGLMLPEWEANFLASFNHSSRQTLWFTEGRRHATDRMWSRSGGEINHPHPLDQVSEGGGQKSEASPDGCEFWMKDDGRQRRCNEPAAFAGRRGLRYCAAHAEEVRKNFRGMGKAIELHPFKGEKL